MIRSVALAVALLLVSSVAVALAETVVPPSQNPQAGSHVFGAKGCSRCHAVNGVGGRVGPDLGRIPRPRSLYDLSAAMWNHLPAMAAKTRELDIARPTLDGQEAGDLIGFLFTLNYFGNTGNADTGKRLFTEKKCVVCHQIGGVGGVIGPSLDFLKRYTSPIFIAAELWNHAPEMAEAMRQMNIERPVFKNGELLDLLTYLKAGSEGPVEGPLYVLPGRPEQGRRVFAEKQCAECHAVAGRGGRIGPDLADRAAHLDDIQFAAEMWNKTPGMLAAMKPRGMVPALLRPEEMADIIGYLYSVRFFAVPGDARAGRRLLADKGCLSCHSLRGKGGKAAGDLARARFSSPAAVMAAMWNHLPLAEQGKHPVQGWAQLTGKDMADLDAFLQGRGRSR